MEPKSFLNQRVLLTGATSGIGRACATYLLNEGAKVVMCGRDLETLKLIGQKFPEQAAIIKLDLVNDLEEFELKETIVKIMGGLDIVINAAGVLFDGDLEKTYIGDYEYSVDLNLKSIFSIMVSVKDIMSKGGSIVNVSCLYGSKPKSGIISHCMSKKGLELLTKYAAAEFAELGIRVNAVTACPVDTNSQRYVGIAEAEISSFKERVGNNIPLGRMATPDDVAKGIIFLASSRSSKTTGIVLKIDGGRSLTSSGFVPYKGIRNMNARFEPDGVKYELSDIWTKVSNRITGKKDAVKQFPLSEEDIDKLIAESNWSTRLSEAHEKVGANYKNIEQNNSYLKEKFVNKI